MRTRIQIYATYVSPRQLHFIREQQQVPTLTRIHLHYAYAQMRLLFCAIVQALGTCEGGTVRQVVERVGVRRL